MLHINYPPIVMPIETTTRISIHPNKNYYYTVEDEDISTSTDGITISYYEKESDSSEVRVEFLTMTNEVALAIADAIYKLQKRTNDATN